MAAKKVGIAVKLTPDCWEDIALAMKLVKERVAEVHGLDWNKDGHSHVTTERMTDSNGIWTNLNLCWKEHP